MKSVKIAIAAAMLAALALGAVGCVQYPTEKQQVVDLRPQISFSYDNAARADARVVVDGLDAGRLGDFAADKGALRVLSGAHVIRVVDGNQTLLEQHVFLGDGVNRSFSVQ